MESIDFLQKPRLKALQKQLNEAEDEKTRIRIAQAIMREIRANSDSIIDRLDNGIAINNLDEVEATFHNELSKQTVTLAKILSALKVTAEESNRISERIIEEEKKRFKETFQTIVLRKPREEVTVINLDEIKIPENVSINNLSELKSFFDKLEKTINNLELNVEAPVVNVPAPVVNVPTPIINVPQTKFPDIDINSILDSLDRNLKILRTNNKSHPLAVRLSDGGEWIKQLSVLTDSARQIASFSSIGEVYLKGADGSRLTPAQNEPDVLRAFSNVAASSTDSSIVSAVTGKKIRVVAMSAVAGATATNLTFNTKPAGAGTAISPLYANGANGGEVLPYNPRGWFETSSGEGLTVTTGSGASTGILVNYITV